MGLPGYRTHPHLAESLPPVCLCAKQRPKRVKQGALVLTLCKSCGLIHRERRGAEPPIPVRNMTDESEAENSGKSES